MGKKIIAFSHPFREQLAKLVLGLEDFDLENYSKNNLIILNKKDWNNSSNLNNFNRYLIWKNNFNLISFIQKKLGLINFKFYLNKNCDLILSNNSFLFTNKPYVIYLEKATAIFGYTAKNYNSFIGKCLLYYFLKQKNLKLIIFRTKTAKIGFLNTFKNNKYIFNLVKKKSVYFYPPINYSFRNNLNRFKNIKNLIFLFNSSSFLLKGGFQVVRSFIELSKKYKNIKLILITKISTIDKDSLKLIKSCDLIELYDSNFSQEELFKNFYLKSHILVYPTYSDSFSMVINEAINFNMPIITSDFFSIPERVDSSMGFLFESPYKNYFSNFKIFEEHISDDPKIILRIYNDSINGKLKYVETFLYNSMKYFIDNIDMVYIYAKNVNLKRKKILNTIKQKKDLNLLLLNLIKNEN
jgi:hypothetical protein